MTYLLNLEPPEGYSFVALPGNVKIRLPNNEGQFTFLIKENNNKLQLKSSLILNGTIYEPSRYASIRQFFDCIVSAHSSTIVLKKLEAGDEKSQDRK